MNIDLEQLAEAKLRILPTPTHLHVVIDSPLGSADRSMLLRLPIRLLTIVDRKAMPFVTQVSKLSAVETLTLLHESIAEELALLALEGEK